MTVYRTTPLPKARARGNIVVPQSVIEQTVIALLQFGHGKTRHEGLVYWAGRYVAPDSWVLLPIVTRCEHSPGRVSADEAAIGQAARMARKARLGIIAQVHSHPTEDTRHSEGDDKLVLMPFENMFSLVAASYGTRGLDPKNSSVGLHQFQDGRWVQVENVEATMIVVPEIVRLG